MQTRDDEQTAIDSLYRISSLVSDTDEPHVALDLILKEIIRVLQPKSASISLINPDTHKLELEVSHGLPKDFNNVALSLGQGVTGWAALHGRSIIVPDVRKEPRYISLRPDIRSEMAVPMEDRGLVIGVVNVDSENVAEFTEQSHKILTLLTNEASRVISRLWLIKQLRTKANQLESLVSLGQRTVRELDSTEIYDGLARDGRQLLDCQGCALFILGPEKKVLHLQSMVTRNGALNIEHALPLETSSVSAAIRRKKQIEVHDLAFTEENNFLKVIQQEGLVSMLSTPIIFGEETIGVLNAYTNRPHRFNNDEKKIFSTLAGIGAIAIQNSRLYSRVFSTEESLRRNEKLTTLGMLAAEIAHEIRNPLTVIKLLFQSLDLEFQDDDIRKTDVTVIGEKLDQLEDIVERVLSFGRNREGLHARYDLNQLTKDTILLVRLKLYQQKIEIEFIESEHALYVEVNKGQIQQVMLNLILNATQVMPEGGKIIISTNGRGDQIEFIVSDNGPGISEDIQDNIFESFLTDRPGGTGLGLSISKRILRSHRGDIELVESSERGSAFKFWLPAPSPHA
ncbi:MAG: GAF domain-containing protein [Opitutaceae bacterium]